MQVAVASLNGSEQTIAYSKPSCSSGRGRFTSSASARSRRRDSSSRVRDSASSSVSGGTSRRGRSPFSASSRRGRRSCTPSPRLHSTQVYHCSESHTQTHTHTHSQKFSELHSSRVPSSKYLLALLVLQGQSCLSWPTGTRHPYPVPVPITTRPGSLPITGPQLDRRKGT